MMKYTSGLLLLFIFCASLKINGKVWALSRFDQKSLSDKKPPATQIMLGEQISWVFANTGILEADDGSVWFIGVGATGKLYSYDLPHFKSELFPCGQIVFKKLKR